MSNLPVAQARDPGTKQVCQMACEPLPGGKDDAPERVCVETCEQGAEIVKTKTKEVMENGKLSVEVLGKVVGPALGIAFDCPTICSNPIAGGGRAATNLLTAGIKFFTNDQTGAAADAKAAAAQATCTAFLLTPAGYAGCMTCCAAAKVSGVS